MFVVVLLLMVTTMMLLMMMVMVLVVVMEMMVMVMAMLLFLFTGKGCANMFLKSTVCDLYISWPTERSNYCEAPLDGVQFH